MCNSLLLKNIIQSYHNDNEDSSKQVHSQYQQLRRVLRVIHLHWKMEVTLNGILMALKISSLIDIYAPRHVICPEDFLMLIYSQVYLLAMQLQQEQCVNPDTIKRFVLVSTLCANLVHIMVTVSLRSKWELT